MLQLSFRPARCFPNNWKMDGDYPPDGGQCNSFLGGIHRGIGAPISESAQSAAMRKNILTLCR
jgi:hypothetical protein